MRASISNALFEMAGLDPRVMIIGSDLGPGAFDDFERAYPGRSFMEGISEQYVVGMAAGMAAEGLLPYVQTIATFLTRRAFEQIYIDVGLQKLPVRLLGSGAGLVYSSLGPTHAAIDDLAIMSAVPNLVILVPRNAAEAAFLLKETVSIDAPVYLRISKGPFLNTAFVPSVFGSSVCLNQGGDILVISTGIASDIVSSVISTNPALTSSMTHVHVPVMRPFPGKAIVDRARSASRIITVEEHVERGGLTTDVLHALNQARVAKGVQPCCLPDRSGSTYGSYAEALEASGLGPESLAETLHFAASKGKK